MPKAEVGSTKYIANKMKAKGLQRLRWYCQICEKQCRDENGFKQHTQSEGHVRGMLMVGEDPKKVINNYSRQFQGDFLQLLKTAHGEKKVHMNNFYQEYIRDKEHIHMNATRWPSLTEFAKHLGREGICRVEEGDRGIEIQWIDDSPEAIRRREDIKRKEQLSKGEEDIESRLLAQQIKRAKEAEKKAAADKQAQVSQHSDNRETKPAEPAAPVKISLGLKGAKPAEKQPSPSKEPAEGVPVAIDTFSSAAPTENVPDMKAEEAEERAEEQDVPKDEPTQAAPAKVSLSLAAKKTSNPLAAKKNPFAKKAPVARAEPEKKMSNAERIMKEELERKRLAEERGGGGKRQRFN